MKVPTAFSLLSALPSILALNEAMWSARWRPPVMPIPPTILSRGPQQPATTISGIQTFQQLIDHNNPSAGTFGQRWWYSTTYWKAGGPIILFPPGEVDASQYTGYVTNQTLTGVVAQEYGGAVIILEHRYFGASFPVSNLTTYNMRYLNINQNLADLQYFAQNVVLPFSSASKPTQVPWILAGGSYSGTLAAYAKKLYGDLFWIGYSTSGPLEPIIDFGQYQEPIQLGMPSNCSADAALAIAYVDAALTGTNATLRTQVRQQFGLGASTLADDDFGAALEDGPYTWQDNEAYTGYTSFYSWCDALEGGKSKSTGVGTTAAVTNYATWFKNLVASSCGTTDADIHSCFDTHNANQAYYTDVSTAAGTSYRSWMWMVCSQFGWFQTGNEPASSGKSTIVSILASAAWFQNQCNLMFPADSRNPYNLATAVSTITNQFGGWSLQANRLWITNAKFDPWRSASYSSDFGPQLASTPSQPVQVIPNGIHCWDLIVSNWNADPSLPPIVDAAIAQIGEWLDEF